MRSGPTRPARTTWWRRPKADTMRQLRDRCLRAKAEARSTEDAAAAHRAIHDTRHCRTWTDRDGAFRLDARLTPDTGASLLAVLTGETDSVFRRARRAGRRESPDAYRADALVALVTGRGVIGRPGTDPPSGTGDQGTEDTEDTDSGDPTPTPDPTRRPPRAPDPRALVTLRVDLDALRRGSIGPGEICEIPGVGPVPVETARELMGDAITRLVITNGVDVTTVCHLGRSIPSPLRTALVDRDPVCVVPGCDTASGLEIDHGHRLRRPGPGLPREPGPTVPPSPPAPDPPGVPAPRWTGTVAVDHPGTGQRPDRPRIPTGGRTSRTRPPAPVRSRGVIPGRPGGRVALGGAVPFRIRDVEGSR